VSHPSTPQAPQPSGAPEARIAARIDGTIGTVVFAGEGSVRLLDDAVELRGAEAGVTIAFAALDGASYHDAHVTLHVRGGARLHLSGTPRLAALVRELAARASALPELTRALRTMGSHRAHPGPAHDRVFGPLLAARRRAERSADPMHRLGAFDAPTLRGALDEALAALAAERCRASPPDERALRAHLDELFEPLAASLDALGRATAAVREAAEGEQFARWRDWSGAASAVFADADRCWQRALPLLEGWRVRRRPLWRRVLGWRRGRA
jgi:hypothetical protein